MSRRGFSLAELMVALVIAGVIGVALTRLVLNQSRFVATQQSLMSARAGARAGLNVIVSELRMVTLGGAVLQAAPDSITVRVPYAFGVACLQPSGGSTAVALFPADSATYADAAIAGYAWRDAAGVWQHRGSPTVANGLASDCSGATPPITVIPNGRIVRLSPNVASTTPGSPVYLYQNVRYALAPSAEISGRLALWRTVLPLGTPEELVTPFDTASTFMFLTGARLVESASPPAVLDSLRGLRVRFVGQSEETPQGRAAPSSFTMTTDVVFVNRAP